jgi:hypothetical protein
MPNESHTTHVDSRNKASTPTTSTEPWPRPDLRSMELQAADRALMPTSGRGSQLGETVMLLARATVRRASRHAMNAVRPRGDKTSSPRRRAPS